jgi:hypothetical protein
MKVKCSLKLIEKMNHFILKTLLILIYATNIFVICFSRFQQHHLDLDVLVNKIFEQKQLYNSYISQQDESKL